MRLPMFVLDRRVIRNKQREGFEAMMVRLGANGKSPRRNLSVKGEIVKTAPRRFKDMLGKGIDAMRGVFEVRAEE